MRRILLLVPFMLAACNSHFETLEAPAIKALEAVTCPNSESRLFDLLYSSSLDLEAIPTETDLQKVFQKALQAHPEIQVQPEEFLLLVREFYSIVLKAAPRDPKQLVGKMASIEVGDQTTIEAQAIQSELRNFQKKWTAFQAQQAVPCTDDLTGTTTEASAVSTSIALGARRAMVTAYQSCAVDRKPAMTATTPDVQGISVVGTHSGGVGSKREITDLSAVKQTDYYLQNLNSSPSCKDIRSNPPIYDFGGKPYTTSSETSNLNFFKNAGSGTSALGIDCSGYVFSAIAASGLKLHPDKKLKASLVHGISASMYMEPERNGMPCFNKVKMGASGTLKVGDVVAISGHIVVIESVGVDPLGLAKVRTIDQCADLQAEDFNFTIIQSSPSKNGIGINKYFGPHYLAETPSFRSGFEKYARDACKAKFQNKDLAMTASNFQIIRHSRSPSCVSKAIPLEGESCAASCSSLASSAEL